MSSSSSRAVSMMIGTVLCARRRLQTSSPSSFGSIRSSTTRSTCSLGEAAQRLLAVARLDDAEAVALERVREELLDRVLVVDEEDGGGVGHRRFHVEMRCLPILRPTIARRWPPLPPASERRRGRAAARSSGPSTAASTAAPGCSSACRSCCSRSASRARRRSSAPALPPPSTGARRHARRRAGARATPTARPGPPARPARRAGSREQLRSTGSRSAESRSPPTSRAAAASRSSNLLAVARGRSPKTIVVMAHRDDTGAGPGANDNASGTAALIELARAYAPGRPAPPSVRLPHTLVFLSTDGGAFGGLGAAQFAAHAPERRGRRRRRRPRRDRRARRGRGSCSRATRRVRPRPALVATAAAQLAAQTGRRARRAERAPPARRPRLPVQPLRAGAVRRARHPGDDADDRRRPAAAGARRHGRPARREPARADRAGDAAAARLARPGPRARARAASYVYLGSRIVRGWAIELVLVAVLLPFLVATVDLFARCRRRRIPLAPGAAQLPQPARLLALGRRALRAVRAARRLAAAARPARRPSTRGRRLARARRSSGSPSSPGSAGSSRATGSCRAAPVDRRGGARRPHRRAARARRRRAARRRDEPVRAHLPPAVAARLALAAAGATERRSRRGRRVLVAGFVGPGAPALVVRGPLRARARRALVPRLSWSPCATSPLPASGSRSPGSRRRAARALAVGRYAPYPGRARATAARPLRESDAPLRARAPARRHMPRRPEALQAEMDASPDHRRCC